jgi:uncharacterized membrane protein HdeD (DUF308 family)
VQRWLARQNKGRPAVVAIIGGLLLISAGLYAITYVGQNPAPAPAIAIFIAMGIYVLAIGIAQIREER